MEIISIISLIGFSFDVIGKVMIAYTAIKVHFRVWKEHKIDEMVFSEMKNERLIGIVGILLIILGFILQLPSKI